MVNKTVTELTALGTTPASNDRIGIYDVSASQYKYVTPAQLLALYVTGAGVVATGGYTLTVGGTSTINGSVVGNMTGSGTIATGGFTGTLPATGTFSLLGTAQTYSALKTFSSGISLGAETLDTYDEGTWTPQLRFGSASTGMTFTTQTGTYIKIGKLVWIYGTLVLSAKGSSTGTADISGLPFTAANGPPFMARWVTTATSFTSFFLTPTSSTLVIRAATAAQTSGGSAITDTAFNDTSQITFAGMYSV